jgi:SNF2 family DNA or RNA helicase
MLKPFKHQAESVKRFEKIPCGLDYSDAGTGKTRIQIDLFSPRRRAGGGRALILAPKTLLEAAWIADFEKFAPDMKCVVAYARNREKAFNQKVDVYITNIDATRWLARQKPSFFKSFETLIIDEISAFKHRTSLRSRCLKKIIRHFRYRYGLTGTPNANHILDVWHQALIIDRGERLGTRFAGFRNAVSYPVQVGPRANMLKWEERPGAPQVVSDLLSDITVRYELDECHDIPKNHVYQVPYHLTRQQRAAYVEMEKYAILEISQTEVINAVNAASLMTKLLQIASGTVYDEQGVAVSIEDDRYQLIIDLIKARKHSVVFFNWRHQADALVRLCQKEDIPYCKLDGSTKDRERGKIVSDFQDGHYQVCFAHPLSAAHGVTLTKATTTIWASPTHNLEHFIQGNHRIHRAGQKKRTETILIAAQGTIEPSIYVKLEAKDKKQLSFLSLVKTLSE